MSPHDHRVPHHRRCIRLRGYDYAMPGAYFVTICTWDRLCLFGEIADDAVRLSAAGEIAAACWCEIPTHFPDVELDASVMMPNHVHGIINIVGATHASPLPVRQTPHGSHLPSRGPRPYSVGAVVGSFKSATTRRVRGIMNAVQAVHALPISSKCRQPIWQRNYYEHIVRDEATLTRLRQYIADNPARWAQDDENPSRIKEVGHDRMIW